MHSYQPGFWIFTEYFFLIKIVSNEDVSKHINTGTLLKNVLGTHNFNSIIYYSFNYFKECSPKWTLNTESYWKDSVWDHYHSWVSRALRCLFLDILSSFMVVC